MTHPSPPRILVIDNDERITYFLQTILTLKGYDVHSVDGVGATLREKALDMAQQVRPHIAIVDLRLDDEYTNDPTGLRLLPEIDSAACILYSAYLQPTLLSRVKREYKVFDWVDKQNIEALYTTVADAAYQMSASQRKLTIQWPASWQREKIVRALFKDAPTQPGVDILDDMIAQLFTTNQRVVPETVTGAVDEVQSVVRGRSVVLKVHVDTLQPMVLKLGKAVRVRQEYENYEAYIHNHLLGLFHTQIERHNTFWDLGGTVYSFVGAGQQVLPTFTLHYAHSTDVVVILAPLHHLFHSVWQPHYEAARPMEAESLFAAYDEIFDLEERFTRIDDQLIHTLQAALPTPLLNPIAWVRTFGRDSTIPSARQAITHGDLHGDNLFVEGDHAWIIDFERAGPSHALRDFAELEVDIFARLIPGEKVDWSTLYHLARLLVGPSDAGGTIQSSPLLAGNAETAKAIQVINGIRQLAREVVRYSDPREYLWAMLFDAIFVASINAIPEQQRTRALLYAGVICERLKGWGWAWS
jgi:CheY-like chemotaxis protein